MINNKTKRRISILLIVAIIFVNNGFSILADSSIENIAMSTEKKDTSNCYNETAQEENVIESEMEKEISENDFNKEVDEEKNEQVIEQDTEQESQEGQEEKEEEESQEGQEEKEEQESQEEQEESEEDVNGVIGSEIVENELSFQNNILNSENFSAAPVSDGGYWYLASEEGVEWTESGNPDYSVYNVLHLTTDTKPHGFQFGIGGYNYSSGFMAISGNTSVKKIVFDSDFYPTTAHALFSSLFQGVTEIVNLNKLHTENVTDMSSMFESCQSLTSLDLSSLNTGNVTNMQGMFTYCTNLTSLDFSSFDTSNVTNMSGMFRGCRFTSLDVSSFNTENVTNTSSMFITCSNLTSIDLSTFDTENVTDMSYMFYGCSSLTSINLSSLNTENVTNMANMFKNCSALTNLDLSSFNAGNVTNMASMFEGCSSLTSLDLTSFTATSISVATSFSGCTNLKTIYTLNNNFTGYSIFNGCSNLVGGNGTKVTDTGATYAKIDNKDQVGYFTDKNNTYNIIKEIDESEASMSITRGGSNLTSYEVEKCAKGQEEKIVITSTDEVDRVEVITDSGLYATASFISEDTSDLLTYTYMYVIPESGLTVGEDIKFKVIFKLMKSITTTNNGIIAHGSYKVGKAGVAPASNIQAAENSEIYIYLSPEDGFEKDSIKIINIESGNANITNAVNLQEEGGNLYSFIMPDKNVRVEVTYKKIRNALLGGGGGGRGANHTSSGMVIDGEYIQNGTSDEITPLTLLINIENDKFTLDITGRIKDPKGNVVGNIYLGDVLAEDRTYFVDINGNKHFVDGTIVDIYGNVRNLDGSVTALDGITYFLDGSIIDISGVIYYADGTIKYPDGSIRDIYGLIHRKDGSIVTQDGTIYYIDGSIEYPDGTKILLDGTVMKNQIIQKTEGYWEYNPLTSSWRYLSADTMGEKKYYKNEWIFAENKNGEVCWYIVDDSGDMITGWIKVDGEFYYMSKETETKGELVKGDITIDGKKYNLDIETGKLLDNVEPDDFDVLGADNHKSGVDGEWKEDSTTGKKRFMKKNIEEDGTIIEEVATNWYMVDGHYYFFDEKGVPKTGLIISDDKYYYLEDDGRMLEGGERVIDGITYIFDKATGACRSSRVDIGKVQ